MVIGRYPTASPRRMISGEKPERIWKPPVIPTINNALDNLVDSARGRQQHIPPKRFAAASPFFQSFFQPVVSAPAG
jgi:hypothetical protein